MKKLRENKHLQQQEVAKQLNISNSTLSKIEKDKRMLESVLLNKFAEIYKVSTDYLVGRETIKEITDKPYAPHTQTLEYVPIPIYGEIRANTNGIAYYDHFKGYRMISSDQVKSGQYYYLIVSGDDMQEEGIPEGCTVLVKQQNTIESGKLGVILLSNQKAALKRIYHQPNHLVVIQSAHHKLPPEIHSLSDVQILGEAVQLIKDL